MLLREFGPHLFWRKKNGRFVNSCFGLMGYDGTSYGSWVPTFRRNLIASIAKVVVAPNHIYKYIPKSLKCIGGGDTVYFIRSNNHISKHSVQFFFFKSVNAETKRRSWSLTENDIHPVWIYFVPVHISVFSCCASYNYLRGNVVVRRWRRM